MRRRVVASLVPRRGGRHRTFGQWAAGACAATLALHAGRLRRVEPWMSFVIVLAALSFLMLVAYRGHSVILFAPIAALGPVLPTAPSLVAPILTGLLLHTMVGSRKLSFPLFLLVSGFG